MYEIVAPTDIKQPLYEGLLEAVEPMPDGVTRADQPTIRRAPAGLVISLGHPQYWNLAQLAREKGESLPPELILQLRDADFYLLELACSFLPERNARVTWARLNAYLQPRTGSENPVAFDIFPRNIDNETESEWKVNISPSLKFSALQGAQVEGKLGEIVTSIRFQKIEPLIVGFGLFQPKCGWDFESQRNKPLLGIKSGYLIVKKPKSAQSVRLILDMNAEVITDLGRLSGKINENDKAHLSVDVCSD